MIWRFREWFEISKNVKLLIWNESNWDIKLDLHNIALISFTMNWMYNIRTKSNESNHYLNRWYIRFVEFDERSNAFEYITQTLNDVVECNLIKTMFDVKNAWQYEKLSQ